MKIKVNKRDILVPLEKIKGASNGRVLPILGCAKITGISQTEAIITASDSEMEASVTISIESLSENHINICVDHQTLVNTLKKMPNVPLEISYLEKSRQIKINYGSGSIKLATMNAEEFPEFVVDMETEDFIYIDKVMAQRVQTAFQYSADDELRPVMNGVYFDTSEGNIVSSDGHRLYKTEGLNVGENCYISPFILPKTVNTLLKNLEHYKISASERFVIVKSEGIVVKARLIEGRYPNYNSVIPKNNHKEVIIDTLSLKGATDRTLLASSIASGLVKLNITPNSVELSSEDIDFSAEAKENVECLCDFEDYIGLKGSFLITILNSVSTDSVKVLMSDKSSPLLIYPFSNEKEVREELFILMPMLI